MEHLPKFSIIIPNLNNGNYLKDTLSSIINQNYRNIEVIVIDGCSEDNSIRVIKEFEEHITFWASEKDGGQTNAINKGFKHSTGDLIGWMNSDDVYENDSFCRIANYYKSFPDIDVFFADKSHIDQFGNQFYVQRYQPYQIASFANDKIAICNQSCFWKISVFDRVGYLDENINYAMDYEYFLRMGVDGTIKFKHFPEIWGAQRYHQFTKTSNPEWIKVKNMEINKINKKYNVKSNIILKICVKVKKVFYHIKNGHLKYIALSMYKKLIIDQR